jgi:hypothetical protein
MWIRRWLSIEIPQSARLNVRLNVRLVQLAQHGGRVELLLGVLQPAARAAVRALQRAVGGLGDPRDVHGRRHEVHDFRHRPGQAVLLGAVHNVPTCVRVPAHDACRWVRC